MRTTRWNHPVAPSFAGLINEIFNEDNLRSAGTDHTNTIPKVNVTEGKDSFLLELAAPGLSKKDFKLNLDKNRLTVKVELENKEVEKTEGETVNETVNKVTRREFNYSNFQRAFTLPKSVDAQSITATYKNGILALALPKKEEAKELPARQIEIK